MQLRTATAADAEAIRRVHREAFGREAEGALVDRLRSEAAPSVSQLALVDGAIVAHALFTPAQIELANGTLHIGALGPVGVRPPWQRRGIGDALIRSGIEAAWRLGWPALIVLGEPAYYRRFGFVCADALAIRCALGVPAEAFQILCAQSSVRGPGLAHYHPAFTEV